MFALLPIIGLSVAYSKPEGSHFHFQSFDDPNWADHWSLTQASNYTGVWSVEESKEPQSVPGEKLLVMKTAMSYYGASTRFPEPLDLTDKTLVLQYEVRFQEALECGGAYIKLFGDANFEPTTLTNESRYVIMFGPDKCGATNKVHFIFRHKSPITGEWEEKHMKDAPAVKTTKESHLYTLIVRPDNSFEVMIDGQSAKQGSLLEDFAPSVNPPKEIDDPTDKKPEDWVDDEYIPDPEAVKPEDWDETQPEFIPDPEKLDAPEGWLFDEPDKVPDPEAQKSEDWDDDIHGVWEPPMVPNPKCEVAPGCGEYHPPLIKNPAYKGKWEAPQIKNPAYKGEWKPRQIPNPNYFEDAHPHNFPAIYGAGFELWMVNKEVAFGNVLISNDEAAVHKWNKEYFIPKFKAQEAAVKKAEPKDSPDAASNGQGFVAALQGFANTLKDAWMNLYSENAAATIAFSSVAVIIPLSLCFWAACKKTPVPEKRPEAVAAAAAERTPVKPKVEEEVPETPIQTPKAEPEVKQRRNVQHKAEEFN